eukprot:COSAG01_NODE_1630_length_9676_cov_5.955101_6_plen_175_part_00
MPSLRRRPRPPSQRRPHRSAPPPSPTCAGSLSTNSHGCARQLLLPVPRCQHGAAVCPLLASNPLCARVRLHSALRRGESPSGATAVSSTTTTTTTTTIVTRLCVRAGARRVQHGALRVTPPPPPPRIPPCPSASTRFCVCTYLVSQLSVFSPTPALDTSVRAEVSGFVWLSSRG